MGKEVITLAILVSLLLVMNTLFILVYNLANQGNSIKSNLGLVINNDPVKNLFSKDVLAKTISQKTSTKEASVSGKKTKQPVPAPNIVTVKGDNGFEMIVNYDKMTVLIDGKEIPIIVDKDVMPVEQENYDYDKDGNIDLIRKEVDGNWYVYINKATNQSPVYREGVKLQNA